MTSEYTSVETPSLLAGSPRHRFFSLFHRFFHLVLFLFRGLLHVAFHHAFLLHFTRHGLVHFHRLPNLGRRGRRSIGALSRVIRHRAGDQSRTSDCAGNGDLCKEPATTQTHGDTPWLTAVTTDYKRSRVHLRRVVLSPNLTGRFP